MRDPGGQHFYGRGRCPMAVFLRNQLPKLLTWHVCSWPKADVPALAHQCPLLSTERTRMPIGFEVCTDSRVSVLNQLSAWRTPAGAFHFSVLVLFRMGVSCTSKR